MLCAVPLLRALRQNFPHAHITLIASPVNHEIMQFHPYVNEVLNYDKFKFFPNIVEIWKFYRNLRSRNYDLAIVPATVSTSITSGMLALISGARVRIGPKRLNQNKTKASYCFTTGVDLDWRNDPRRHQTLRNLDILRPLAITIVDLSCTIGLTREEKEFAWQFLMPLRNKHKHVIGLHPGAGKSENRWPAERFASIAYRLSEEDNAGIVITAGPRDEGSLSEMRSRLRCPHLVAQNRPIRETAAIIDALDLFITNDTGIMHVAGATETNVLALFGPTDALQWAPIGPKNRYIASRDRKIESLSEEDVYGMISLIVSQMDEQRKPN